MNWPWLLGNAAAVSVLAGVLTWLGSAWLFSRDPEDVMGGVVAIWLGLCGGLPLGALLGAGYALWKPQPPPWAGALFLLLGVLVALPMGWITWIDYASYQESRRDWGGSDPNRTLLHEPTFYVAALGAGLMACGALLLLQRFQAGRGPDAPA
jgi:hypothetical protein